MSELHHECGLAAVYHLPSDKPSPLCPDQGPHEASRLLPRMLLDVQNRGQLSAGMTTWSPNRNQLLQTYKDVGTVSEFFRLSHRGKAESLMKDYAGCAAIGHVRYATCGAEDRSYANRSSASICKSPSGSALLTMGNWPTMLSCATKCSQPVTAICHAITIPKSFCTP